MFGIVDPGIIDLFLEGITCGVVVHWQFFAYF
jgi:hypothetical protein